MTVGSPNVSVLVRSADVRLVLSAGLVSEILRAPTLRSIPGAPAYICGAMVLRGSCLMVADLRFLLGLATLEQQRLDLVAMLDAREADHRRWLAELEACVREGRAFTLALDPHKCAFGRWYDVYQAPTLALATHLWRFRAPHDAIHALGETVLDAAGAGRTDEALASIETARSTTLSALVELFAEAKRLFRQNRREVILVLRTERGRFGLLADQVDSVEDIDENAFEPLPPDACSMDGLISRALHLPNGRGLALALEAAPLRQLEGWM